MKLPPILAGAVLCLAAAASSAQVLPCTDDGLAATTDGRLLRAARQLQEAFPEIGFEDDPTPCVHARQTARALAATVGTNPWRSLAGFEYIKVTHGNTFFTVERLVIADARRRASLAATLGQRRPRKLAIKANTVYQVRVVGDSLVLMISPAAGYRANAEMLDRVHTLLSE